MDALELSTSGEADISCLDNEDHMLQVAEALMKERVQVTRITLDSYQGQLSHAAAMALKDAFRENKIMSGLVIRETCDHLSILLEGVAASRSIKIVLLNNCTVSAQDIQDIPLLANLEELAFSCCRLGIEAVVALSIALMPKGSLHGLQTLRLFNSGVDNAQAAMLAAVLRHNTSLRVLDLDWNKIGVDGTAALVDALEDNETLTRLQLS
jgi:hypothetical protein